MEHSQDKTALTSSYNNVCHTFVNVWSSDKACFYKAPYENDTSVELSCSRVEIWFNWLQEVVPFQKHNYNVCFEIGKQIETRRDVTAARDTVVGLHLYVQNFYSLKSAVWEIYTWRCAVASLDYCLGSLMALPCFTFKTFFTDRCIESEPVTMICTIDQNRAQ